MTNSSGSQSLNPEVGIEPYNIPRVGVCVFILNGDKVLFGLRQGSHGANTWSLPGGKVDLNEDLHECVRREALEETGLELGEITRYDFTNDIFTEEGRHFITLYYFAKAINPSQLENKEPNKCAEWKWVPLYRWPKPLFFPLENLIKQKFSLTRDLQGFAQPQ